MQSDARIENRNLRLLLVDDHQTVRQGLRALFRLVSGVEVVDDVANGDAAIEAIRILAPDLVVIDLSMAPTDGLTVLRRVKEARRQTKFVVLTRYREAGYVREALAAGALGYVLKQSAFSELESAVAAAARGERHIDSAFEFWSGSASGAPSLDAGPTVSAREVDVLRRAAIGQTNIELGEALGITVKTVEQHKANAMKKLGLRGRTQLTRYAVLHGWLHDA